MKLKSDLSKVKVGDWVLTLQFGWGKVEEIAKNMYPIKIRARADAVSYSMSGKRHSYDTYPTCFPIDQAPECFLEIYGPPPVEFREHEPVWISEEGVIWKIALFLNRDKDGTYWVYDTVNTAHYSGGRKGYKYCRKLEDKP